MLFRSLPDTQILPAFQTVTRSLSANWQLTSPFLPRVDLGYTSGHAETNGSVYRAAQNHEDFHAGVIKESTRLRHAFRYDNNDTNNVILSAYDQRNKDLDYEFGALLTKRSRLNVHAGRRRMASLFDVPVPVVDPAAGGFTLPSRGDTSTRYVVAGISVDPTRRISIEASGSADRQTSSPASIGARLLGSPPPR